MRNDRAVLGSLFLAALVAMSGCASSKVTRVDTASVTDLSGRWNDTDSRLVAEAMIKEAISQPWLDSYTRAKGRPPVVIIGTIANRTLEHINVQTFVSDLERELTNSQRVIFVAGRGEREEVREEPARLRAAVVRPGSRRCRPERRREDRERDGMVDADHGPAEPSEAVRGRRSPSVALALRPASGDFPRPCQGRWSARRSRSR